MRESSQVPAWATTSVRPSAVTATPHGFAPPRSTSSRSTVFTYAPVAPSNTLSAAVFIQPRSSCVVGSW